MGALQPPPRTLRGAVSAFRIADPRGGVSVLGGVAVFELPRDLREGFFQNLQMCRCACEEELPAESGVAPGTKRLNYAPFRGQRGGRGGARLSTPSGLTSQAPYDIFRLTARAKRELLLYI